MGSGRWFCNDKLFITSSQHVKFCEEKGEITTANLALMRMVILQRLITESIKLWNVRINTCLLKRGAQLRNTYIHRYIYTQQEIIVSYMWIWLIVCTQVVSLLHLDNLHTDYREEPSPGYPLVCVSVSWSKFR